MSLSVQYDRHIAIFTVISELDVAMSFVLGVNLKRLTDGNSGKLSPDREHKAL